MDYITFTVVLDGMILIIDGSCCAGNKIVPYQITALNMKKNLPLNIEIEAL